MIMYMVFQVLLHFKRNMLSQLFYFRVCEPMREIVESKKLRVTSVAIDLYYCLEEGTHIASIFPAPNP